MNQTVIENEYYIIDMSDEQGKCSLFLCLTIKRMVASLVEFKAELFVHVLIYIFELWRISAQW